MTTSLTRKLSTNRKSCRRHYLAMIICPNSLLPSMLNWQEWHGFRIGSNTLNTFLWNIYFYSCISTQFLFYCEFGLVQTRKLLIICIGSRKCLIGWAWERHVNGSKFTSRSSYINVQMFSLFVLFLYRIHFRYEHIGENYWKFVFNLQAC